MKVLVINWRDIYNPEAGGAEIHIDEILKRKPENWEVDFVSSLYKNASSEDETKSYKIYRIPDSFLFNYKFRFSWDKIYSKKSYDLIIDDISKIPLALPIYVKNTPIIALIHHVHGKSLFRELSFPLAFYVSTMERYLLRYYVDTPIITVSESTKKELMRLYPYKKISVSNAGIDLDNLTKCYSENSPRDPILLYLGRLKRYKRIDHIIRSFAIVKKKINNAELWIVGKGDDEKRLKKMVSCLELDKSVKFLGFVPDREKFSIFSRAKIYLISSEKEGWGNSVIEANAAGLPVIGYDVEGLRDSISDGFTGYLVENGNIEQFAEKTIQLLENDELSIRMSRQANLWASSFGWDNMARNFYKIIRETYGIQF
jgi:glycosyltransferase involved in cell wall biosynthesis